MFCVKGCPFIGETFDTHEAHENLVEELRLNCPEMTEFAEVEETAKGISKS